MSRTIAGLLIILLGYVGVAQIITETDLTKFIDLIIQAVGIAYTWYVRYSRGDINLAGVRK